MKKIALLILVLVASFGLQAQNDNTIRNPRPKVGVVLGGGGAKGAAHIGVLKYLEELGIPVDYVAGTSMGAIIGGFYAMGYSPQDLEELIKNMDWSQYIGNKIDRPMMSEEVRKRNSTLLLNVPFSLESLFNPNAKFISQLPSAYVNNSSLVNLFNDLCVGYQEEMDFNDMPIPFACVATDMVTGDEATLHYGSVPTAMRASMAIPGVFSPVTIGDKVLVDGGLVNNFPADVVKAMGADIIIGVEISSTKEISADDLQSLPQVFSRLLINSTSAKKAENRTLCRVHITPDISGYGMLSFTPEAIETLVKRGYDKASEYHDALMDIKNELESKSKHPANKMLKAPRAKNLTKEPVLFSAININNVSDRDSKWLMRKGNLHVSNYYKKDDIERALMLYRGTGCFDEVTYQIKEADSIHFGNEELSKAYCLNIYMKPAQPHTFGMGVRYDTEEGSALLFHLGLNEKKFGGSKLNASLKLSYNPKFNLTYTYSQPSLANFNLAYDYRNEHFRTLVDVDKATNLHYWQHKVTGSISQFHLLNFSTSVGMSYQSTVFDLTSLDSDEADDYPFYTATKMLVPFANMVYDNLDDAYFAKNGVLVRIGSHYYHELETKERSFDLCYSLQSFLTPNDGKVTIIPQVYGRYTTNSLYYAQLNLLGGELASRHFEEQMPFIGLTSVEIIDDNASIARCDLRYNIQGNHYLTAMYNYLFEWSHWESGGLLGVLKNGAQGAGLKYSYNSILGPISLTAHWINTDHANRFGAYFSFGYTF